MLVAAVRDASPIKLASTIIKHVAAYSDSLPSIMRIGD
jgi:hypothetical protein